MFILYCINGAQTAVKSYRKSKQTLRIKVVFVCLRRLSIRLI
jgi:hypothetical protein